ncbi:hypothetical protein [Bradyrhizobium sp. STM 3566]|uniref:hypothetical protein n=1 Tax=Bradyrhizobium sp. STM 3566 TaxID=578928 RepID=UPI00388DC09A
MSKKPSRLALTRRREAAIQRREWRNSPEGRLDAAGRSKYEQMNRRALWLAIEWHLPRCPKIGRTITAELVDYCQIHGVSVEWLIRGDLKGLQRMMEERRARSAAATPESLKEKLSRLSDSEREIIRRMIGQMELS